MEKLRRQLRKEQGCGHPACIGLGQLAAAVGAVQQDPISSLTNPNRAQLLLQTWQEIHSSFAMAVPSTHSHHPRAAPGDISQSQVYPHCGEGSS